MAVKDPDRADGSDSPKALSAPSEDVVLVHGVTGDGEGLAVIRKREDRLELGAIHPLKEGKPIHGEVVRLKPRAECPLVCDVEVTVPAQSVSPEPAGPRALDAAPSSRKGPAQVSSPRYRENWDAIWKKPAKRELSN
jgi:hypothetical protein